MASELHTNCTQSTPPWVVTHVSTVFALWSHNCVFTNLYTRLRWIRDSITELLIFCTAIPPWLCLRISIVVLWCSSFCLEAFVFCHFFASFGAFFVASLLFRLFCQAFDPSYSLVDDCSRLLCDGRPSIDVILSKPAVLGARHTIYLLRADIRTRFIYCGLTYEYEVGLGLGWIGGYFCFRFCFCFSFSQKNF